MVPAVSSSVENKEAEVDEVLSKIEQYNRLHAGGIRGFINVLEYRIRHPERFRINLKREFIQTFIVDFFMSLFWSILIWGLAKKAIMKALWNCIPLFSMRCVASLRSDRVRQRQFDRELEVSGEQEVDQQAQGVASRAEKAALDENDVLLENNAAVKVAEQEQEKPHLPGHEAS